MAGECGRRSESCCMTPCFLNPTTSATSLKSFARLPKEKPARNRTGFALDRLEAPSGVANVSVYWQHVTHAAIVFNITVGRRVGRIH